MIRSLFTPMRIALVIGLALAALRFEGCLYLHLTDVRAMDYRLLQRGPEPPGDELVIVAIDDKAIAKVGRWPWARTIVARLVEAITAADPAVIGFDVIFSEPSQFEEREGLTARPPGVSGATWQTVQSTLADQDRVLADAIRASGRVVLGYFLEFGAEEDRNPPQRLTTYNLVQGSQTGYREVRRGMRARSNLPALSAAASEVGFFDVIPDTGDGFVRRMPMVLRVGDEMAVPLALAMLKVYRPQDQLRLHFAPFGVESVQVGSTRVPVAEDGQLLIDYRGPGGSFPRVSAADILDGKVDPARLRGKLVLVGVTAKAVQDIRVTPFDAVFPGVELHANVIDNILHRQFIDQPRWLVLGDMAVVLLLALGVGLAMRRARGVSAAIIAAALTGMYLVGSQWLFLTYGFPLTIVYALLAVSFTYAAVALEQYVTEEREKRKMRGALELYLSPSMAHLVSEQPERLKLGGEKRDLTVLFSDLRGFTSISEGLEPEELVELLNVYLGEMTNLIFEHDGMLDKYIGDAVMAVWGAPLPQPDHAVRACIATVQMKQRLAELNSGWKERGWPHLQMGIGLNSGPMVFGNMGSAQHLSLTVMGDNVNLGSRLEGVTKLYGATIIASEATVQAAGSAVVARELDQVRVKGKLLPVRIYEILGLREDEPRWVERIERFATALVAYRERRFEEAHRAFAALTADHPDDGPSILYARRCEQMCVSPPGSDWNGVTVLEVK